MKGKNMDTTISLKNRNLIFTHAKIAKMTKTPNFFAVDFYCGAGGTTRGLLDAGGYVIAGIDNDEKCNDTFKLNNRNNLLDNNEPVFLGYDMFPKSTNHPQGEQEIIMSELKRLLPHYRQISPTTPLLFSICAPCQSFTKFTQKHISIDRMRKRSKDKDLLSLTIDFIKEFEPEMIISENVASINSSEYSYIWHNFQLELSKLGYSVTAGTVCASKFGVPQNRKRSFILAMQCGEPITSDMNFELPNEDPNASSVSVSDAIGHFPKLEAGEKNSDIPNHVCRNLTEINKYRLMSVEPGKSNHHFDKSQFGDLSLLCHRKLEGRRNRGFGDVYTRMHPDRPSPTITTRFMSISNGRFGHFDPTQVRGLSLREGAALQSFPDNYKFLSMSIESIATMIGNAVPPKLSAFMAIWLVNYWKKINSQINLEVK